MAISAGRGGNAITAGLLTDALVQAWGIDIAAHVHAGHEGLPV
ncbi:hypothetical protein [Thiothrix nivea]|nr:hypothetical protein [Thiothrix nivea]